MELRTRTILFRYRPYLNLKRVAARTSLRLKVVNRHGRALY
jgi:hypothetical protein